MDSSDVAYERDTYEEDCNALQKHIDLMGGAEYGV